MLIKFLCVSQTGDCLCVVSMVRAIDGPIKDWFCFVVFIYGLTRGIQSYWSPSLASPKKIYEEGFD